MLVSAAALAAPVHISVPADLSRQKQVAAKDTVAKDTVPTDTVVSLREVTVEGQTQRVISHGVEYTPGANQKRSAISGADLLLRMGIPQLNVTPGSESVTDNFGNAVQFFINGNPATQQEVSGIRPSEVKTVQYLQNPTDPRFRNALRAVNFIVKKMEWGGYTKLQANQSVLAGMVNYETLFSKFAYKAMTYDFYAQGANWRHSHYGTDRTVTVTLPETGASESKTVTQEEKAVPSRFVQKNYPLTFRALYEGKKITVSNRLNFGHWGISERTDRATMTGTAFPGEQTSTLRSSPERENSLAYAGDVFITLPHNYSITLQPSFKTGRIHSDYEYSDTQAATAIVRRARERNYTADLWSVVQTTFRESHTAILGIATTVYDSKTDYTGNTVFTSRYRHSQVYGMLSYAYQKGKLYLNPKIVLNWRKTTEGSHKSVQLAPLPNLTVLYNFNSKHSAYAYLQYTQRFPSASSRVGELFQQTNLLWTEGNPELKPSPSWSGNASYDWIPSNKFSLNIYGMASADLNKVTAVYGSQPGVGGVVRGFHNNGDYKEAEIGVSATLKLLGNSLQFSATPQGRFTKTTGLYESSLNRFSLRALVSYYRKGFYASASYRTPTREFMPLLNQYTRQRASYIMQIGWGNSNWNLRMEMQNIFRKNWVWSTSTIDTPVYKESMVNYNQSGHGSIFFSATYTIGYGKPVNRNEVGAMGRSESSIAGN